MANEDSREEVGLVTISSCSSYSPTSRDERSYLEKNVKELKQRKERNLRYNV